VIGWWFRCGKSDLSFLSQFVPSLTDLLRTLRGKYEISASVSSRSCCTMPRHHSTLHCRLYMNSTYCLLQAPPHGVRARLGLSNNRLATWMSTCLRPTSSWRRKRHVLLPTFHTPWPPRMSRAHRMRRRV